MSPVIKSQADPIPCNAWVENKNGKARYFVDDSNWFSRSVREVSKVEYLNRVESLSTLQKVLRIGLSILALGSQAPIGFLATSLFSVRVDAQAVGTEFQVNNFTENNQLAPKIITLPNDDYIVFWNSENENPGQYRIYGQKFAEKGMPIGSEFKISPSNSTYYEAIPRAVVLNSTNYVITWMNDGEDSDEWGIFGRHFDTGGNPVGNQFQVNSYTTSSQRYPNIARLNHGGFIVVWHSLDQDGSSWGVFAKCFDSNNIPYSGEFQVNTYTLNAQEYPYATCLKNGHIIVSWESDGQDGDKWGIYGQLYYQNCTPIGTEFKINTRVLSEQWSPNVIALNDGGFFTVWNSLNQDGSMLGIYGQRFHQTGTKINTEFQVNTYVSLDQQSPIAETLNDGSFVITWESDGQDGDSVGVFGQRFDPTCSPLGSEFQINTYTNNSQSNPSVAGLSGGGFVVVWDSEGQDGDLGGIYGKLYDVNGNEIGFPSISSLEPSSLIPEATRSRSQTRSTILLSRSSRTQSRPSSTKSPLTSTTLSSTGIFTSETSLQGNSGSLSTANSPTTSFNDLALSIVDVNYEENYEISHNGQNIGTFTFSGGTGQVDSTNTNTITIEFNSDYTPSDGDVITLFTVPNGTEDQWEDVILENADDECLNARGAFQDDPEDVHEYQVIFEQASTCITDSSKVVARIAELFHILVDSISYSHS